MPLVSVIMPAHNREDTICASIRSVLCQTMESIELIIVDDCSTDSTTEVVSELALSDPRIRFFKNKENCGAANTRNYAIDVAAGEFIAILDSDDLWEPNKLNRQLNHIQKTGCDLCYSSYDYFDIGGMPIYKPYIVPKSVTYKQLLKENVIGHSTIVLRKSALGDLRYDKNFFHEDFALLLKLLRKGLVARGIPEVLTHNRIGGRSENKWEAMKNRWRIYRSSEKLSFGSSCWYLLHYIMAGIKKYWEK